MPQYLFECKACDISFSKTLKVANHSSHECPQCTGDAQRVLENFGGASFAPPKTLKGSTHPTNTGVHHQSYPTADMAIGRSAEARWGEVRARDEVKKEARIKGETNALIRHTSTHHIDYEPMSDAGIEGRKQLRRMIEKNQTTSE